MLSKEELLLLSNLLHIKKESEKSTVFEDIWNGDNVEKSLKEILEDINKKLATLSEAEKNKFLTTVFDGEIEGSEWQQMLQSINNNPKLSSLTLRKVDVDDKGALSICLTDSNGQAYVVFRGTGPGEWPDNFDGAYKADTKQQRRALAFVQSLSYNNIIVIGHSKGGNKAKYVAILSNKVLRCVSFDGQGFSREFWEKYAQEVEGNKWKIENYALSGDFVNPLLIDINAENKKYIEGFGVGLKLKQLHSPSSFFHYVGEEYGFEETEQNEIMKGLHGLVNYIVNVTNDSQKEILFTYLGGLADRILGKKPPDYEESYTKEELIEYMVKPKNIAALKLLLAYMLKYEESVMGVDISSLIGTAKEINIKSFALLLKLIGKISDEDYQKIRQAFKGAKEHYKSLPEVKTNKSDYKMSNKTRDFTETMKQKLMKMCDKTVEEPFYDIERWNALYGSEKWMSRLNINGYKAKINEYYKYTEKANIQTKKQINKVFEEVEKVDKKYAGKIDDITKEIKKARKYIEKI